MYDYIDKYNKFSLLFNSVVIKVDELKNKYSNDNTVNELSSLIDEMKNFNENNNNNNNITPIKTSIEAAPKTKNILCILLLNSLVSPMKRKISLPDPDFFEDYNMLNESINTMVFNEKSDDVKEDVKLYLDIYNEMLNDVFKFINSSIQMMQKELRNLKDNYNNLLIKNINSKENIIVYVRVKPCEIGSLPILEVSNKSPHEIALYHKDSDKYKGYEFDYCFSDISSQNDLYNEFQYVMPMLLKSYNVNIISYGSSGSGKTYSLYGNKIIESTLIHSNSKVGVTYRICYDLYYYIKQNKISHKIEISVIEIGEDGVVDLLSTSTSKLVIDSCDNVFEIPKITIYNVKSLDDVINLIDIIIQTRNDKSNKKTHCLLSLRLIQTIDGVDEYSYLNIIDLSYSNTGYIHDSARTLFKIIKEISENKHTILYNENIIASLIKDTLNSKTKNIFLYTLNSDLENEKETSSVLKLASKIKEVKLNKSVNNFITYNSQIEEINKLKEELSRSNIEIRKSKKIIAQLKESHHDDIDKDNKNDLKRLRDVINQQREQILKLRNCLSVSPSSHLVSPIKNLMSSLPDYISKKNDNESNTPKIIQNTRPKPRNLYKYDDNKDEDNTSPIKYNNHKRNISTTIIPSPTDADRKPHVNK